MIFRSGITPSLLGTMPVFLESPDVVKLAETASWGQNQPFPSKKPASRTVQRFQVWQVDCQELWPERLLKINGRTRERPHSRQSRLCRNRLDVSITQGGWERGAHFMQSQFLNRLTYLTIPKLGFQDLCALHIAQLPAFYDAISQYKECCIF